MLHTLPVEALEAVVERVLDLDMAAPGNPIYPYDGRFEGAHMLKALSEVTLESSQTKPFHAVCESFLWRIFNCDLDDTEEVLNDPNFDSVARHVRSFTASMRIGTDSEASFTETLENMQLLDQILNRFSNFNLKHIRLNIHAEYFEGTTWALSDPANVGLLEVAHQQIITSLGNFPSLTALDLENCFALMSEEVVSQCIWQLPNLIRFRAQENAVKLDVDLTQGPRLGEALASRTKLEELSLKNLGYPAPTWCDLDWQGPVKSLALRGCGNLDNQALFRFIFNLPSLEKIHLQDHHFRSLDISTDANQIPFPNLKSFTFLGVDVEHHLFDILAKAPLLETVHCHSAPRRDCLQGMRHSILEIHRPWPSLREVIISFIRPTDQARIWLDNWCTERGVRIVFHFGIHMWNVEQFQPAEASDDEDAGDASEEEFEPSDDSEVDEPEDWKFSWRLKSS